MEIRKINKEKWDQITMFSAVEIGRDKWPLKTLEGKNDKYTSFTKSESKRPLKVLKSQNQQKRCQKRSDS